MRYGIVGGDLRFVHLAEMLREDGHLAAGFLHEKAGGGCYLLERLKKCDCIISNWPMKWPLTDRQVSEHDIMENIASGSVLLLCGPQFPTERRWDLQYVNLWQDEILLQENAYLTAEGAVAAVISRMNGRLGNAQCLVIGYGRIGRALTEILLNLGAKVTVATRGKAKFARITESGASAVELEQLGDALADAQAVFSTPPSMVVGKNMLERMRKDALIVDLASPPYGVDLDAAAGLGIRAWREPNLPGRYCPLSAARVLYNAVLRWEERENAEA